MNKRKELYRDSEKGKIAGVCAGIAEYFGIEVWLVRIGAVTGLVFSSGFFFVAYIAAWFILDKKPDVMFSSNNTYSKASGYSATESMEKLKPVEVKEKVWQSGEPPRRALLDICRQFDGMESRLRTMEKYVTSPEYTVTREINKL
nr:envelope stress response membrane protein PspC [Flocculibacter collagenilyticus]